MGIRKKLIFSMVLGALIALVLLPSHVMAATAVGGMELSAGNMYYLRDKNISGNGVTSNSFTITPTVSGTAYDIVYAQGTRTAPIEYCAVNVTKTLKGKNTSAYIKTNASDNIGMLLGIRIRKGKASLRITSTGTSSSFRLTAAKLTMTPLASKNVAKGRKIQFRMSTGNLSAIPLVFGGTKGTKIRRRLSSTKHEIYTFNASSLKQVSYVNGKASGSRTFPYETSYKSNGKKYLCKLINLSAATSRVSGSMQTTKGAACFVFPRDYLGLEVTMG